MIKVRNFFKNGDTCITFMIILKKINTNASNLFPRTFDLSILNGSYRSSVPNSFL